MKVIVDIKNKTLKMLENERSIFKGEYSADKLELYINKQLENEYPVITGLLSNGRRIGAFTTDDGYEIETIDGVEYTKAKFTLSKENGFPLSAGVTQITIWMYRTKDSVLVSKEAIGNVVFTVVDTTAFNDGDIIISGDVEGTVVNLKVEVENLQSRLEQYLPLSGAKAMTGDLNMDDHDIKNVSTIGVDGPITTATKLLVHDENDDIITNSGWNYNASYYYASGIKFTTAQEQSKYNLYYPKETGTFVVRDDAGGVKSITSIIDPYENNGIVFGLLNDETTLYNPDSTIGLSSTEMINEGDIIHSLKFPDTSELTGDGSWKTYTWNLPKQSGTIALLNDFTKDRLIETIGNATQSLAGLMSETDKRHLDTLVNLLEENNDNVVNTINEILAIFNQYPEGAEILSVLNEKLNKSELLPIIEENAEKTSTLDIGTSETFDATSDEQIPTSKAVSDKFQPKLTEGEGISILGNEISISSDVIRNVNEIFEFEHTPDEQKEIYLGQTVNTNFPIWMFIIRKIPHDNGDGTYWYSEESGEYYIYFTENKINLYSDSEGEDISATDFLDGCSFGGKPYVENTIWFADNNIISVEISYVPGVFSKIYDM